MEWPSTCSSFDASSASVDKPRFPIFPSRHEDPLEHHHGSLTTSSLVDVLDTLPSIDEIAAFAGLFPGFFMAAPLTIGLMRKTEPRSSFALDSIMAAACMLVGVGVGGWWLAALRID